MLEAVLHVSAYLKQSDYHIEIYIIKYQNS